MKKFNFYYLIAMFAIVLFACSCNKSDLITSSDLSDNESNNDSKQNAATWFSSGENGSKFWFLKINIKVGHTIEQCGGDCVKMFGEKGHIDCRGFGNVCNHIVDAQVIQTSGGGIILALVNNNSFGDDLDFLIPDRSLYIINPLNNTDLWLNIPEQVLLRDDNGVPFEILDVWFSEEPELENK